MPDLFRNLLASDELARRFGVGLHPKLREALLAELRFPAKSSGPVVVPDAGETLPDNVRVFSVANDTRERETG